MVCPTGPSVTRPFKDPAVPKLAERLLEAKVPTLFACVLSSPLTFGALDAPVDFELPSTFLLSMTPSFKFFLLLSIR